MDTLTIQIDNYLITNFNYDPNIDKNAYEYSQTLDKYDDGRWNFKPRQNLQKCILENINYKMLIPDLIDGNEK